MTNDSSLWLRNFHTVDTAAQRLVCLPHAGGSASYYFGLSKAVAATGRASAQVVQYPGRQDRRRERLATDLRALAAGAAAAVAESADDRPVVLFGHSMGALVAYEVARALADVPTAGVDRLVVSGRRSPTRPTKETVHLGGDRALLREMRELDGTASDLIDDQDMLDMILPPLRADYRALETYVHEPSPRLDLPVTAIVGDRDPRAPIDEVEHWTDTTTGPFAMHVRPGGHFYLAEQWPVMADLLVPEPAPVRA